MFDLDRALADWRRQMTEGGVEAQEVLDELEGHVREEVEQQVRSGADIQQAFEQATQQIGPARALRHEFAKAGPGASDRAKHALLVLAGIPIQHATTSMNKPTSPAPIEPAWATYLKAVVFLVPALGLWAISLIFVFPKLQQICLDTGISIPSIYRVTNSIADHNVLIVAALLLTLFLLEWRSIKWPRYRRASIGIGVFLVNSAVLCLITFMVILAIMAAPALAQLRK